MEVRAGNRGRLGSGVKGQRSGLMICKPTNLDRSWGGDPNTLTAEVWDTLRGRDLIRTGAKANLLFLMIIHHSGRVDGYFVSLKSNKTSTCIFVHFQVT